MNWNSFRLLFLVVCLLFFFLLSFFCSSSISVSEIGARHREACQTYLNKKKGWLWLIWSPCNSFSSFPSPCSSIRIDRKMTIVRATNFDSYSYLKCDMFSFLTVLLLFLFVYFYRRKRVCPSQVNDWIWFVTRWSCAIKSCHRNSRPRPWNWRKSSILTRWPVRHRRAGAATSACSHSGTSSTEGLTVTHRPRRPLHRRTCWANQLPSRASSKSDWWAARICWRTFQDVRGAIQLIQAPMTLNPSSKVCRPSLFSFFFFE